MLISSNDITKTPLTSISHANAVDKSFLLLCQLCLESVMWSLVIRRTVMEYARLIDWVNVGQHMEPTLPAVHSGKQ